MTRSVACFVACPGEACGGAYDPETASLFRSGDLRRRFPRRPVCDCQHGTAHFCQSKFAHFSKKGGPSSVRRLAWNRRIRGDRLAFWPSAQVLARRLSAPMYLPIEARSPGSSTFRNSVVRMSDGASSRATVLDLERRSPPRSRRGAIHVTVGYDTDSLEPKEIFYSGGYRSGSDMEALVSDSASRSRSCCSMKESRPSPSASPWARPSTSGPATRCRRRSSDCSSRS